MNLRTARLVAGWTAPELGRIVSCHPQHIHDIERGESRPSRLLYAKLKAVLPELDDMETREKGRPRKEA